MSRKEEKRKGEREGSERRKEGKKERRKIKPMFLLIRFVKE